jgi:hypothetical protein
MHSRAILRAYGIDGPCQGVIYLDLGTGRVLFNDIADAKQCTHRISDETIHTAAGSYPAAYFDHYAPAQTPDNSPR